MIIGLGGTIGSGKGTVADYLVDYHGFEKVSFADKLKDAVAVLFDWPREMLEGATKESREWREVPDEYWSAALGKTITPRYILQVFGTECMRNGLDDNIWVHIVAKKFADNPDTRYVIPDCRFYNEQRVVWEAGGQVWSIFRDDIPEWWGVAVNANRCGDKYGDETIMETDWPDLHQSEWRWARPLIEYDTVIYNHKDLNHLFGQVTNQLKKG